jgi:hypothetical protein
MRRRIFFTLILVPIALAWATQPGAAQVVGNPGDATIVVYPTAAPHPTDVTNVQWALDNVASPGTVVMKSTDMSGNPLAFDFGGTKVGNGGVVKLLRPDITLTGDGWDDVLDEPKTKIVGGGGPFILSPSVSGAALVFAIRAPGVTIREIELTTSFAATGVFIVSTAEYPAIDHPVVVERNHISANNYGLLARNTAAFPVKIDGNVFRAAVDGQWIGFTLRPITTPVNYDEPVVPEDASGNFVRYAFEVTNNGFIMTKGTNALRLYGWGNYYNVEAGVDPNDPDIGCKRYVVGGIRGYQCVSGDNGPVLVSGNRFSMDHQNATAIALGSEDGGLNHVIVAGNTVSGLCSTGLRRYEYGTDTIIIDNDFSGTQASYPMVIAAAGTLVADNILGSLVTNVEMPPGIPQPALWLTSRHFYPGFTPMPWPTENCVIMNNDYRFTGVESGAILLASIAELRYPTLAGAEVKNNLIFESGNFPTGTGGASNQVTVLNIMINPATGLPYVYNNRIVGLSAKGLSDPGIGQIVKQINKIRKMLREK